jgi:hypothetical protein
MAAEDVFERQRDFADRGLGARRVDGQRQQISITLGAFGERVEFRLNLGLVALGAQALQLVDLAGAHRRVFDLEHVDRLLGLRLELVDADHGLRAGIDARLRLGGGFLDAQLRNAGVDGLGHAAERLDFLEYGSRLSWRVPRSGARRNRSRPTDR